MSPVERLIAKTVATDHGLIWSGAVNSSGYGVFRVLAPKQGNKVALVHRYWYEVNNGPIPAGYDVDHVCHLRRCLTHLRLLTASKNRAKVMRTKSAHRYRLDSERRIYRGIVVNATKDSVAA